MTYKVSSGSLNLCSLTHAMGISSCVARSGRWLSYCSGRLSSAPVPFKTRQAGELFAADGALQYFTRYAVHQEQQQLYDSDDIL